MLAHERASCQFPFDNMDVDVGLGKLLYLLITCLHMYILFMLFISLFAFVHFIYILSYLFH